MRNLVRKPLTWMVVVECVVMAALLFFVWNLFATAALHRVQTSVAVVEAPSAGAPSPGPALPTSAPRASRGPLPGLNMDSGFWRSRLGSLNHEQTLLERLQWRLTHMAMDAARHYLETVVLPSVTQAARG